MANTPLFHELHAALFHSLVNVINEVHAGAHLTRKDVLCRLQPLDPVDASHHEELIDMMFSFESDGEASLQLEMPVRLPPTKAELRWLKTMLEDEAAAFLVADDLREKLLSRLVEIRAYPREIWRVLRGRGDDVRLVRKPLGAFWRALREGRMIFCRNVDAQGRRHESKAAPCRLEYAHRGDSRVGGSRTARRGGEVPRLPGSEAALRDLAPRTEEQCRRACVLPLRAL